MSETTIYIVGVEKEHGKELYVLLEAMGYESRFVTAKGDGLPSIDFRPSDIVITAVDEGRSRLATFQALHGRCPATPVIVLTRPEESNLAREAILKGAWDFLFLPIKGGDVTRVIVDAMERIRFFH